MGVPFHDNDNEQEERHLEVEDDTSEDESDDDQSDDDDDQSSSSSSEEDDDEHPDPHDTYSTEDSSEWEDPSEGGILSLLFRASELGDARELTSLIQSLSVPLDTPGGDGDTALHLTSLYGHVECARILLEHGHRADCEDEEGAMPLHDAAAGGYLELVNMLLDAAPDCIHVADDDGDTPLHNAARGGSLEMVELLLRRGADPAAVNNEFKTPAGLAQQGTDVWRVLEEAEERQHNERREDDDGGDDS